MAASRRVVSVDLDALDLVGRDAPLLSTSRAEGDSADRPRTDAVEKVTGRKAGTFEACVRRNIAAFK